MWASVDDKGNVLSGHRVKTVENRSPGVYDVTFEGRLEGCSLQATARGSDPILATIEPTDPGADDLAIVRLFDMRTEPAEPYTGAFDIAALCPA